MDKAYIVPQHLSRTRSYEEAVAEVERELGVRRRCFDRWVTEGRIDAITAAERYQRLSAALQFMQRPDSQGNGTATQNKSEDTPESV